MRFRIRFAEQIVGLFIIIALVSIILVIVFLGSSQRWFNEDGIYYTELETANGISVNMSVQYRGFTIGHVTDVKLDGEVVKVTFSIHEDHKHRVMYGSIMQLEAGPLGALLGNRFIFIPGRGSELIPEGRDGQEVGFVPLYGTPQADAHIRMRLVERPDIDSIGQIIDGVANIVGLIDVIFSDLQEALQEANDETPMGRMVGSITQTIEMLPDMITMTVDDIMESIVDIMASINPIIDDIGTITSMLAAPDGTVAAVLDSEGEVYVSLVDSLQSVSGILDSLDQTVAFIPRQLPQLAALIMDLQVTLETANDVLLALVNNPLLRGGIPDRIEYQAIGTSPRDIRF